MSTYAETVTRYMTAAMNAGMTYEQANSARRDAQRIHTISEQECNGTLVRIDGETWPDHRGRLLLDGKVYQVCNINGPGPLHYYRTADRETPARARIEAAAASIGATVEFQGDPRGWPVTITTQDGQRIAPPCR